MSECPDSQELRALAAGQVAPVRALSLVQHLTGCRQCLAIVFPDPVLMADTARPLSGPGGSSPDAAVTDESPGRYQILRELGRGGQARVYVAFDRHLGREVAMKVPLAAGNADATAQTVLRFLREARITAGLEHPNIVPIHEIGRRADGTYYCTQRLIRPAQDAARVRTLRSALSDAGSSADRMLLLPNFLAVCNAVAHAHSRGVIHRDLKPENVVIGGLGETVVLDWGLGRIKGDSDVPGTDTPSSSGDGVVSLAGSLMGTPSYMSPEQARGAHVQVDERSDAWSLGAMLYEILTGHPPFLGANAREVVSRVLTLPVVPVLSQDPEAPAPLAAVAMRALARDPGARYPSAAELSEEIAAWLSGLPVRAYRYSLLEQARLTVNRHRSATAVAFIGLALLALASALVVRNYFRSRSALAQVFVAHGRTAEANLQWDAAAAYFAAARVQEERLDARYGAMLTANRAELLIRRLSGHTRSVYSLAQSPDGRTLASASFDRTVRLWDLATGETKRILSGHQGPVTSVAFSPDGRWVATASEDRTARLWALDTVAPGEVIATGTEFFAGVAFSPDSRRVAIAGEDSRVWLVSLEDRTTTTSGFPDGGPGNHGGPVYVVAFTPDGGELVSAGLDATVRFWSADGRFELHRTLKDHRDSVLSLRFSPDGKAMATASRDSTVILYGLNNLQHPSVLEGHEQKVYSVAFSPNSQLLASGGTDRSVRLWLAGSRPTLIRGSDRSGGVKWRSLIGPSYRRDREVNAVTFLGDTQLAWAGGGGDIFVRAIGAQRVSVVQTNPLVVLPRSGQLIYPALGGYAQAPLHDFDPSLEKTWPTGGREPQPAYVLAVSPDEKLLLGTCDEASLCWVDLENHALLEATTSRSLKTISASAFSPNGRLAAVAGHDAPVSILDTSSRKVIVELPHPDTAFSVAFSADGKLLATGSYDKLVRLWNTSTWQLERVLEGHEHGIRMVAFSPDSKQLASASWDRDVRLWDVASGQSTALRGHQDRVCAVAFSPDGEVLASGGWDGLVRLWDVKNRQELARYVSDEGQIWSIAFDPDGKRLYYGGLRPHQLEFKPLASPEVALEQALEAGGFHLEGPNLVR